MDTVFDHYSESLVDDVMKATGGEGASVVLDHVGQATWERSAQICASGGTMLVDGGTTGDDAHIDVTYVFAKELQIRGTRLGTMRDATAVAEHLGAGRLQTLVDRRLPLDGVAEGHRLLERGSVIGKVVLYT